jgi:glucose-6-phosphate 1-dehydrogenase
MRKVQMLKAMPPLGKDDVRPRPVRGLSKRARGRSRIGDGRNLRGRALRDQNMALERRALLHPRRQEPAGPRHGSRGALQTARRSTLFDDGDKPSGNYVRFRLGPDIAIGIGARRKAPGRSDARAKRWNLPLSMTVTET